MRKRLRDFPETEERLFFQLLSITSNDLGQGASPRGSIADALQFKAALSPGKVPDYLAEIEKIISQSFRLLEKATAGTGDYRSFELTLAVALTELNKHNPNRFKVIWKNLNYPKRQRSRLLDKVSLKAQ